MKEISFSQNKEDPLLKFIHDFKTDSILLFDNICV